MELANKIAIVTGGGGAGSGRAISHRLALAGATVVVADVDEAGAAATVAQIADAGGRAHPWRASVSNAAEVEALFSFAEQRFGGVDVLVNDASAPPSGQGPLDGWSEALAVDLGGTLRTIALALPQMQRRGGGAIVNIASTSALPHGRDRVRFPAYDAAKAGVIRLTTGLSSLWTTHRVRVNCVAPAWIGTPHIHGFYDGLSGDQRRAIGAPDTLIDPRELAQAVLQLATDPALFGRVLVMENGAPPRLIRERDPGFAALEPWRPPDGP